MPDAWEKDLDECVNAPQEPAEPSAPESIPEPPVTPPAPGAAPDGSYHYAPPVGQQPSPYHQPVRQPNQPFSPPPRKNKDRGWIAVVAIMAALAVCISGVSLAIIWFNKNIANNAADQNATGSQTGTTAAGGGNRPTGNSVLEQTPPPASPDIEKDPYCDGGYSTEYIVSKNYASTVVLTMYMDMGSMPYYGQSGLQEVGAASGIVWTADGYIITNCHCVINESTGKKYDRIDVTMHNGTVYENAEVIGADEATDLAVIKVNATDLTPAEFGYSDQLVVGSRVIALGNAAGLSWTATQGIVSAKDREVYEDNGYAIKCLQTDVAINSGNSGGPLLNKFGQVVGINSVKIAASGYEGLGFAIPINEARIVLESLRDFGRVKGRVYLGITGETIDESFVSGFMIAEILEDSCLKGSDAKVGDIIIGVDGVEVTDYGTLRTELAKHKVGDKVTLKLLRISRFYEMVTYDVEVTLKEQQ